MSRRVVLAVTAAVLAFAMTAAVTLQLVRVRGGDISFGTQTTYAGIYVQSNQVSFYWQTGH